MSSIDALLKQARATPDVSVAARARYDSLSRQLSPTAKMWFSQEAARLKGQNWAADEAALLASIGQRFPMAMQAQYDALLLMFGVLAASHQRATLRLIADQLQREQNRQANLKMAAVVPRSATLRSAGTVSTKATLGTDPMAGKLDSLGDISMERQVRLQLYMIALNKTAAMLSNILKKSSDAGQNIVSNLK